MKSISANEKASFHTFELNTEAAPKDGMVHGNEIPKFRFLFTQKSYGNSADQLFLHDMKTPGATKLTTLTCPVQCAYVDEPESTLYYVDAGDLFYRGLNSDAAKYIATLSADAEMIQISKDGEFAIYGGADATVHKLCLNTGEDTLVFEDDRLYDSPRITPDGKHLLFASNRTGRFDLWMTTLDGKNPKNLTKFAKQASFSPAISPCGNMALCLRENGLWVIDLATGQDSVVVESDSVIRASFAPSGKWIVFTEAWPYSSTTVNIVDIEGQRCEKVLSRPAELDLWVYDVLEEESPTLKLTIPAKLEAKEEVRELVGAAS